MYGSKVMAILILPGSGLDVGETAHIRHLALEPDLSIRFCFICYNRVRRPLKHRQKAKNYDSTMYGSKVTAIFQYAKYCHKTIF